MKTDLTGEMDHVVEDEMVIGLPRMATPHRKISGSAIAAQHLEETVKEEAQEEMGR